MLLHRRRLLILPLVVLIIAAYYGFILAIAFAPDVLSQKVGDGVTTLGICLGLGLIFLTFVITGIYVHVANGKIEGLFKSIQEKFV
jgi:uncharacterized membrane protein (DUF485 family)